MRIQKLVKGLKIITDVLPFEKKLESLQNNALLIQYLLLNSIFSYNSV